jgi:type IV secretion system protein VirB9
MKASGLLLHIVSLLVGTGCSVAGIPGARAETIPAHGKVDSRVRSVTYDPDEVYRVRGYVGYQIDLQFADGEEFVGMGAGDTGAVDAAAERNHLFIKPKQEKVGTNITILTNRRHYHFDYTVLRKPADSRAEDVIYSLRFTYPQDEADRAAADRLTARVEERLRVAASARPKNMAYWYCGSEAIRPVSAFDDGVHTHLKFAVQSELPAIFVKNDDKSESLINLNIDRDEVVIHRVARQLVIRRGQLVGCIVNKAFGGGALQLQSGTVSDDVERHTKGGSQ